MNKPTVNRLTMSGLPVGYYLTYPCNPWVITRWNFGLSSYRDQLDDDDEDTATNTQLMDTPLIILLSWLVRSARRSDRAVVHKII